MAKAKLSAFLESASGKLAGSVFHSDASGLRVVNKQSYKPRKSRANTINNNFLAVASRAWRSLTNTQRLRWENARISESTGFWLFLSCNIYRQRLGLSLLTVPVTRRAVPALVPGSILTNLGNNNFNVKLFYASSMANVSYLLYISKPHLPGKSAKSLKFRFFTFAAQTLSTNNNIGANMITSIWGYPPGPGRVISIKAISIDNLSGYMYNEIYLTL